MELVELITSLLGAGGKAFASKQITKALEVSGAATWKAVKGSDDPAWQEARASSDALEIALTGLHPRTVKIFEDPSVRALLSARTIAHIILDGRARDEAFEAFRDAFKDASRASGESKKNSDLVAEDVWDALVSLIDTTVPRLATLTDDTPESIDHLIRGDRTVWATGANNPTFMTDLLNVAAHPARLSAAMQLFESIRAVMPSSPMVSLSHLKDAERTPLGTIYVDRDLRARHSSRENFSVEKVLAPGQPFRCVVLGNPGAGKSTLTTHVMSQLAVEAADGTAPRVPLFMECRSYVANSWRLPMLEAISARIESDLNVACSRSQLEDLASLGRVALIVDGLDEILDLNQRVQMSTRIESFAQRFPLCSILVTSRSIGYDQSKLDERIFPQFVLPPFTDEQVETYATKWFTARDRTSLVKPFMTDSATVHDIRTNPLMLSLLCTLYQARGDIPRDRYNIYKECADLLFYRWDPSRQVAVPEDLRRYGTRIMQELALFYFRSQTAQNGVGEHQLTKLITVFYEGVGVDADESGTRATAFLEYCATRAWLLGVDGSRRNDRIFVFTHRTFMEFYAAEALARRASDLERLAETVAEVYRNEPSSVLPDLIIQAVDYRQEGGARELLSILLRDGLRYMVLCLRVMNLATLDTSIRQQVFDVLTVAMARTSDRSSIPVGVEVLDQLLSLDRDPRRQFERYLQDRKSDSQGRQALLTFMNYWAYVELILENFSEDDWTFVKTEWFESAMKTLIELRPQRKESLRSNTRAITNIGVIRGALNPTYFNPRDLLTASVSTSHRPQLGAALRAFAAEANLTQRRGEFETETFAHLASSLPLEIFRVDAAALLDCLETVMQQEWDTSNANLTRVDVRSTIYWLAALDIESQANSFVAAELLGMIGLDYEELRERRQLGINRPARGSARRKRSDGRGEPSWVSEWVSGRVSVVR